MTIPLPPTGPRYCSGCGEAINNPFSGEHLGHQAVNRARAPVAPVWPMAKPADSPDVRHRNATRDVLALLERVGNEVDLLARLSPNAAVEARSDRRIGWTALARLAVIARELRGLTEHTVVAKGEP